VSCTRVPPFTSDQYLPLVRKTERTTEERRDTPKQVTECMRLRV
jgi:hypothetical protein